ncbi:hypothetical protein MG296_03575 [Flavobacteriaceae bacterium TK19130]|nr:hypothetical protein [Thermobacterium salinum]
MRIVFYMLLTSFFISCQYFETEKISSETIVAEELKTIDWKAVDQYPLFSECESFTDKSKQKECFEKALVVHIQPALTGNDEVSIHSFSDTILLRLSISDQARIGVQSLEIDSLVEAELPSLRKRLLAKIDSIQLIAPAYKRGVPVKTAFSLPIILKTEDSL